MVFVSIFLSLIPAILCGYYGGFGTGFLIYITGVFTSFIGLKIGTAIKKFMGEIFVASKSYSDLFFSKLFVLYGPQVIGFLIGLAIPAVIFFNNFDMVQWAYSK